MSVTAAQSASAELVYPVLVCMAAAGLAVSIATDQVQGIASMLLAVLVTIYVAVTFK